MEKPIIMCNHKQVEIILKNGEKILCDKGIAPVVEYLNGFKNVETYASCQGEWNEDGSCCENDIHCYVFFSVFDDYDTLVEILQLLSVFYYRDTIEVIVGYNPVIPKRLPHLKYQIRFNTKEALISTIGVIKKIQKKTKILIAKTVNPSKLGIIHHGKKTFHS